MKGAHVAHNRPHFLRIDAGSTKPMWKTNEPEASLNKIQGKSFTSSEVLHKIRFTSHMERKHQRWKTPRKANGLLFFTIFSAQSHLSSV